MDSPSLARATDLSERAVLVAGLSCFGAILWPVLTSWTADFGVPLVGVAAVGVLGWAVEIALVLCGAMLASRAKRWAGDAYYGSQVRTWCRSAVGLACVGLLAGVSLQSLVAWRAVLGLRPWPFGGAWF